MLNRLRIAAPTEADIEKLYSKLIEVPIDSNKINEAAKNLKEKLENNESYLCLCSTNEQVDEINEKMINICNIKPEIIYCEDTEQNRRLRTNKRVHSKKKKKTSETTGLEEVLKIGLNARVMLQKNLNTLKGYANGSLGTVVDIKKDSKGYVTKIFVAFDCDKNKTNTKPVKIERINADYEIRKNAFVKRSQFPLTLAWAITIHKCQSLSLEGIIVDLGESVFENGMAYVALSRARKLKNVILLDFVPNKIRCNKEVIKEYNRLRAEYAPELGSINKFNVIPPKYSQPKTNMISKNFNQDVRNTKLSSSKITFKKIKRRRIEKVTTKRATITQAKLGVAINKNILIHQDSSILNNNIKCNLNY